MFTAERWTVDEKEILDSSGQPVKTVHLAGGVFAAAKRPGVDGWTLAVLTLQTLIILFQTYLFTRQTTLMDGQAALAETQQRLNLRPVISVEPVDPSERYMNKSGKWQMRNRGPYSIRDINYKILHFKKFEGHGWDVVTSNEAPLSPELKTTAVLPLNFSDWANSMKQMTNSDLKPILFANLFVVAITFGRDIDDKRYLYLQPLFLTSEDSNPALLRPDIWSSSGPITAACGLDTIAVELAFEYFKKNPLQTPVEIYNYHYLF